MFDTTRRAAVKLGLGVAGATVGGVGLASAAPGNGAANGHTPRVRFENQTVDGSIDAVEIAEAFLPQGGWVIIHDLAASEVGVGPPVGATGYLHPGMNRDVTADVSGSQYGSNLGNPDTTQSLIAMPHYDDPADGALTFPNGDPPYTNAGAPVVDIGVITVE